MPSNHTALTIKVGICTTTETQQQQQSARSIKVLCGLTVLVGVLMVISGIIPPMVLASEIPR
jgi:uncharacterized Tic20 family protein